jgi:hypothetical protein
MQDHAAWAVQHSPSSDPRPDAVVDIFEVENHFFIEESDSTEYLSLYCGARKATTGNLFFIIILPFVSLSVPSIAGVASFEIEDVAC